MSNEREGEIMSVVVAYRPDEYGRAALDRGIAEARLRSLPVVVVNASAGSSYVDKAYAGTEDLVEVERRLRNAGVAGEVRQPVGTDVADAVLETAHEVGAAVLVVGIRHRTPVGKLLLGSTAQQLLLDSECPVLAVKPAEGSRDL